MVEDAADYRSCSHGVWHQSGRHPFAENLAECMMPMLKDLFGLSTLSEVRERMDQSLAEMAEKEAETSGFTLTVRRRVRYWTSGLVIGSETFLRDVMARHPSNTNRRHRVAKTTNDATAPLCAWRRIAETS